jgi:hypothetical protein
LRIDERFPKLYFWFKTLMADPAFDGQRSEETQVDVSFKGRTPEKLFHHWLDELSTLDLGKKPPLRLPIYKL